MGDTEHKSITLYKVDRNEGLREYKIEVIPFSLSTRLVTHKGLSGGAMQVDVEILEAGKNRGRSNETTHYEQALIMMNSIINRLLDKGYSYDSSTTREDSVVGSDGNLLPMLAKKDPKLVSFPAFVQRKYNGVRCIISKKSDNTIHYRTRKGKEWKTLGHLTNQIKMLRVGEEIDGELYCHGEHLQTIASWTKKLQPETSKISFRCYDLCHPTMVQSLRLRRAKIIAKCSGEQIAWAPTYEVNSWQEIMEYFAKFTKEGYEGIMIRNHNGIYEYGTRSRYLIKYKEFQDDEFELVGVASASGRDAGTAIWICKAKDSNRTFNVRPEGSRELRKKYYDMFKDGIPAGVWVTVKYQELSLDGIPIFPVGIAIRDYE